jgi:hypothetical protein
MPPVTRFTLWHTQGVFVLYPAISTCPNSIPTGKFALRKTGVSRFFVRETEIAAEIGVLLILISSLVLDL